MRFVDLRSDTVTNPTADMRKAMYEAEVGDDVYRDDPTTSRLEDLAASMLGKEKALFVPSGTMSNQLALMAHTRRGDEAIVSEQSHIYEHEVGAAAVLSGVNLHPIPLDCGIINVKTIERAIRGGDIHEAPTSLICLENALANGRVLPVQTMREIHEMATNHDLPIHLDGARLFNAAVALRVDVKELTQYAKSVSCCLSKGLCAPVGTILAGSSEFIVQARKYRKMLGGGMRQTGILAAAGILSLTEMTKRLAEDHSNAQYLARLLLTLPGVSVDMQSVQINMVFSKVEWPDLTHLKKWLYARGAKIGAYPNNTLHFLTHYGITREDIDVVIALLREYADTYYSLK